MRIISPGVAALGRRRHGGSSPYVAKAVHFDGSNVSLYIASLLVTDGAVTSGSFWFRTASSQDGKVIFATNVDSGYNNFIQIGGISTPQVNLGDAPDNLYCSVKPTDTDSLNWHSVIFSCNTNLGIGAKIQKLYVDGIDASDILTDSTAAFLAAFNGLSFYLGEDTFGNGPVMDLADFWLAPGVSLLTGSGISADTLALFRNPDTGKPVDPSGFPAAAVLFSGDSSTFPVNQGTGGVFTLTGSLTNASSSPSD